MSVRFNMSANGQKRSGLWLSAPSPCVRVCKYPDKGPCKGCGMLKKEKKRFKKFKQKEQRKEFFRELIHRLRAQEGRRLERWVIVYTRKCEKKGLRS
ncbi:MAG: DUF1289 domain-containing protein, partial [Pseudomonadota bacterium]